MRFLGKQGKKIRRQGGLRLRSEELESRRMLTFDPSGMEQEMMEHLNRMRMDPAGELDVLFLSTDEGDPNYFVSRDADVNLATGYFGTDPAVLFSQWESLVAAPPLAWSSALYDAATAHNGLMISNNTQSHQLPGESPLLERVVDAGYNWFGSVSVGENVFAYTESPFHGHAAFAIDWGDTDTGLQEPAGHRINMMNADWLEVGISIVESEPATFGDVGPLVVTQDFGYRGNYAGPKLLGVVFADSDSDGFYDNGEGSGGITITASNGAANYSTTTMTAGGYQLELPAGNYTVTASGGSLTAPFVVGAVTIGTENEKLDLDTSSIPTTADITGVVFHDANQNGTQDGEDVGLSGYNVYLDANNNGVLDAGETVTTSDASGAYLLTATGGATSTVRYQLPSLGASVSTGGVNSYVVNAVAGQTYADNDFAVFRVLEFNGSTVTAFGTGGNDTFALTVGNVHRLTVNSQVFDLNGATYKTIATKAGAGVDTFNVVATNGDDIATIREADMTLTGSGYSVSGKDFENVTVDLKSGAADYGYLYDGTLDDDMISHPTWGRLVSANYNHYISNFDRLYTYALAGGNDRAYVYDGPTDDRFIGRKDFSIIRGNNFEFYTYMEGFERNFGYSTQGGEDYAFFYDTPGSDNFFGFPTYSVMQDAAVSYFNYASGFDRVFGYGFDGGIDYAYLTDSAGDDRFYGRESFSELRGANYEHFNQVHNFDRVYTYAKNGGVDYAYMYDSARNDVYQAYGTYAVMRDSAWLFYNNAQGFDQVIGYANNGGTDRAFLFDSAANDLFYGRDGYGYLSGGGFFSRAENFDEVTIDGSKGGVNTLNVSALDYVLSTEGTWV